jgi:glycosyltransferase involved in cell wall biosynthesis
LAGLNRFYGTAIQQNDFDVLYPNGLLLKLLRLDPDPRSIQPVALLMRTLHRIRHRFDLVIATGYEEMDLGGPGLLYLHHPDLARFWQRYEDAGAGIAGLLRGRTRPWILLAGFSIERLKQATMIANSNWTAERAAESYGVPAAALYPPITQAPVQLPWESRENSFVATGRWDPAKRTDWIVDVLTAVRVHHPGIRLHVAGTREPGLEGDRHYRMLHSLAQANRDWMILHEDLSRPDLLELLGRCRYSIHALPNEHFGMAPAEAMMAGCIPFVHASGGQVEIAGSDPRLCYLDEEAVPKIRAMLDSPESQSSVRAQLAQRRHLFSVDRFRRRIRDAVAEAIGQRTAQFRA